MNKITILCLSAALLLTLAACGDRNASYAYYEFYCEGDMTLTHGSDTAIVLSDEDEAVLLGIWGNPWESGDTTGTFDYEFAWEDTVIHYHAGKGVFRLADTETILKLSDEQRKMVERIIETNS